MPRRSLPRPRVSVNFAITWDGRISTRNHTPADFSSKADKQRFLEIRAQADAVLVTARTAAADHMTIGIPKPALRAARKARGQAPYPLRVLISNSGRISPTLPLFAKRYGPVHLFTTRQLSSRTQQALTGKATLHLAEGPVSLPQMLATLRQEHGVRRLHCEGGGELFFALLADQLVDDIYLTVCPRIFGGQQGSTLTGKLAAYLPRSTQCRLVRAEPGAEGECFLHYRVTSRPAPASLPA